MQINPAIFREYDIRGIVDEDITEEVFYRIGRAYTVMLKGKKPNNAIAVGRDGRLHSKRLAYAFIDGVTASGVNVVDLGEVPTPLVYFASNVMDVDGGAMITASHNPAEYNGLKCSIGASSIHGPQIQDLRKICEKGEFPSAKKPVTITRVSLIDQYIKRIVKDVKLKRKLKVVIDAGNGASGPVAVPLYQALGCEVIPLYCDVDGTFPNHHPDPTKPENLKELIKLVKKHKADLGIAFDGDGDRIGGCDDQGNVLWGDRLLALFAASILDDKKGATIIGEVKCSRSVYDYIREHGGNAVMSRTGHSLIKAKMKETKAQLAGEMSGHMFFKHRWYGFDDATYAGARLLEIVAASKRPLSAMLADIPEKFATPEINIDTTDQRKFDVVAAATKYFKDELKLDVVTIDGARIEFPDGWGLLRASNTSPKLVVRVEADTKKRMNEILKMIQEKVAQLNA